MLRNCIITNSLDSFESMFDHDLNAAEILLEKVRQNRKQKQFIKMLIKNRESS